MTQSDTTQNEMAQTGHDGQQRGMQPSDGNQMTRGDGQIRTYGDPEWHRGVDAWGNPFWYRSYGWSWTSGGGRMAETMPHEHGRTESRHYRRTDDRIREDVYDRLNDHPNLDSEDVRVSVQDGEVTLEGTVHDRREKRLAEDIADSVSGVGDVQNRLRIGQQQAGERQGGTNWAAGQRGQTAGAEAPQSTQQRAA